MNILLDGNIVSNLYFFCRMYLLTAFDIVKVFSKDFVVGLI